MNHDTRSGPYERWEELNPLLHRAFGDVMSVAYAMNLLMEAARNVCQYAGYYVRDRAVGVRL
jgi:hypothetical protein